MSIHTRFIDDDNVWPPEQPKHFTPLLLVHYQGLLSSKQVTTTAKLMSTGAISKISKATGDYYNVELHPQLDTPRKFQKVTNTRTATKEIKDILAPLENNDESSFILIEGAPGIGKSVLLKEIAYRWGKKEILQNFELVLLVYLRDPTLQQANSVDDLLRLFYKRDKNTTEIVNNCGEYLSITGGKSLTLLLDGYDEYPEHLQKNSLITDIIKRQVLPECGLVISSRPHASQHLRKHATIRVDILGFTESERDHYITQSLRGQPDKVRELKDYLFQHSSIDSICYIPFNMVILLYLYKQGISFPKSSSQLYHHFVCLTICRHLSKLGITFTHDITGLTCLPDPYNRIIMQLSKLSLMALNSRKLIFTLNEITEVCPDIAAIPGAINGFGLLQAVQHFGLYAKTMTLNFIHFTIQEFLAAHYMVHLPLYQEIEIIEEYFWNDTHFNMFSMYMALTKGQQHAFKQFLSQNQNINKFLQSQLLCLRLYRYFNEANDYSMCETIQQARFFSGKTISLRSINLNSSDMDCIALFLNSSPNKEWVGLNLWNCYMQDLGLCFLYRGLHHSNVTINELWLGSNSLTTQSSFLIAEIALNCKVKVLGLAINDTVGESLHLYSMLTHQNSMIEELNMNSTSLSSGAAIYLFTALKDNKRLKVLNIIDNAIENDACDAIIATVERNSCLAKLYMYGNLMTCKALERIVQSLQANNTLEFLGLPHCFEDARETMISYQKVINTKRLSQGCKVKLELQFGAKETNEGHYFWGVLEVRDYVDK